MKKLKAKKFQFWNSGKTKIAAQMNKIIYFNLFIFILFNFLPGRTVAQDHLVQGKVTTFDSIPVVNAEVRVNSTKKVVQTDSLGLFQVFCKNEDKLTVNANGFSKQKVKVEEKNRFLFINLKLKPGDYNRELAIGYGHLPNDDKLFAVSTQSDDDFNYARYSSLSDALIGRFPGLSVRNNEVIIRGTETFGASNAALIVVDGIAKGTSIAGIAPYNIKSVSILKDASAAAYGSQGANGVVLIETKRGEAGE